MACPNPIGVFFTKDGKEIPAPCGRWDCPVCSKVKKNKLLDRVQKGFEQVQLKGGRVRALCLTIGPKGKNHLFTRYFARFRAYLAKPRKHGKKFRSYRNINYFWTKEFQPQTGKLHMHLLIDAYIPWQLIRKAWTWATYGTGRNVDVRMTDDIQKPGGYMTKYMTKAAEKVPGRRFGLSQGRMGGLKYRLSRNFDHKVAMSGGLYGTFVQPRRSPFLLANYSQWLKLLPGDREEWQLHFGDTTIVDNPIARDLYFKGDHN